MSSGAKKPQTIGYWYRPIIHFLFGQGPADALLELRGGDRTAWKGQQTESGRIYVDAMKLWGGEKSEGGIAGYCDVMLGEADQQPSAYLAEHIGPNQPGFRGVAGLVFRGGRYGAMNPYPKPASFKVRRILKGWDHDESEECWYPEKAPILMSGSESEQAVALEFFGNFTSPGTLMSLTMSSPSPYELPVTAIVECSVTTATNVPRQIILRREGRIIYRTGWLGDVADQDLLDAAVIAAGKRFLLGKIRQADRTHRTAETFSAGLGGVTAEILLVNNTGANADVGVKILAPARDLRQWGMNPAHMILDSLVSPSMQGEPMATINQASFAAAADVLHAEKFGLCTQYNPDAETLEAFRQRLCNIIAGNCSRSRVDGMWYLDLLRDDFDKDALPVLTDDDILEFADEVSTLDDAINQVTVAWFDPVAKESRFTAPVQALGAIQAAGTINPEVLEFPEIPEITLAQRVAQRELNARSVPLWRQEMVCNRTPYAWRKGQRFVLQAPRHGVTDMVCMVGDIDAGTLLSGAIRLVAVQDAYSMPTATYLVGQPQDDLEPEVPRGSPQQRIIELPYVELVQRLSRADMDAIVPSTGYIGAFASAPTVGQDFALYTRTEGADYGEGTIADWCPTCTVSGAAGYLDEVFTVDRGTRMALVEVGQRVQWGVEECRLVAFDPETRQIELARGVADTVAAKHVAGTPLYFYDEFYATDGREYAEGEAVTGILLSRTSTQMQPYTQAPELTVEIADRASRPYPPAKFRINTESDPTYLFGDLEISWVHRDRLLQSDQLISAESGSIGPEPDTTYTVRVYIDDTLDDTVTGITDVTVTIAPSTSGRCRIEVESVRDGLASWQRQVRDFDYTTTEAGPLQLEDGDVLETQAGDLIFIMG